MSQERTFEEDDLIRCFACGEIRIPIRESHAHVELLSSDADHPQGRSRAFHVRVGMKMS